MSDGLHIVLTLCGLVLLFLPVFILVAIRKVQDEVKKSREDRKAQAAEVTKLLRELVFAVKARG